MVHPQNTSDWSSVMQTMAFIGLNVNSVVPGDSENNSETNLPAVSEHRQNKPSENTNLPRTQTISDYKQNTRPLLNTNRTQSISQDAQQKYSENTDRDVSKNAKKHGPLMNTNRTQTICEHKCKRPSAAEHTDHQIRENWLKYSVP